VLLKECGVKKEASWIVAEGNENNKYTMSIPLPKAMDDTLVAYAQNGEPVRPHQGYPLRLVVPGWEAIRSVKWLSRIAVVDQPAMSWHEAGNNADTVPTGKALGFRFELGPKSIITRPSGGQRLPGRRTADETTPDPSADLTDQLVKSSGKGRPTPKRSEAQGRRPGPPPPPAQAPCSSSCP